MSELLPKREGLAVPRKKSNHVGAPAIFALELACQHINAAFGDYGCYLVGSALERPDRRDIDVRFIMGDERFAALFPDTNVSPGTWESDPRWLLLTVSISAWLTQQSGLPVDFQIQSQTHANDRHNGPRHALGMRVAKRPESVEWSREAAESLARAVRLTGAEEIKSNSSERETDTP